MGLDMYLRREEYVGGWKHAPTDQREKFERVLAALGWDADIVSPHSPSLTVHVTAAYWRKANSIHRWFVQTHGGGVDECQQIHVTQKDLVDLVELAEKSKAAYIAGDFEGCRQYLPPESGFFFGSTAIDDDYLGDMNDTIDQINRVLRQATPDASFYYQASW